MEYQEIRRLSQDVPNNPDLLAGLIDNLGDLDATIRFLNTKGYKFKKSDFDEIIDNNPQVMSFATESMALSSPERQQAGIAAIIVAVVVAVWVWVIQH